MQDQTMTGPELLATIAFGVLLGIGFCVILLGWPT